MSLKLKRKSRRRQNLSLKVKKDLLGKNIFPNYKFFKKRGETRFLSVTFLEKETSFFCLFENGDNYLFPRKYVVQDELKSKIKKIILPSHRTCFQIVYDSGKKMEIPYCEVRHHCDPSYEYYKFSKKSIEAEKRAKKVGLRIKRIRLERGWTQAELAKKTKIKRENISRMESCKHSPSLDTLDKIAHAFKIPLANLVADPGAAS